MKTTITMVVLTVLAGVASAQPAHTQLGPITGNQTVNTTVPPGGIRWFRFGLFSTVDVSTGTYLDIDTNGSALANTVLGLFDQTGFIVASDDNGGLGNYSLLSFGGGGGTAQTDGGNGSSGIHGGIGVGDYYLSVSESPTTFTSSNWSAVPGGSGSGGGVAIHFTMGASPVRWTELGDGGGDAGGTVAAAQTLGGTGPVNRIYGFFDSGRVDADVYRIRICDPAAFRIDTDVFPHPDTQLALFTTSGVPIVFNDDSGPTTRWSVLDFSSGTVTTGGDYLLAISRYDNDPVNANGAEIWTDTPFTGQHVPDGPGLLGPLVSWNGSNTTGNSYSINLAGVCRTTRPGCGTADLGSAGGVPGFDGQLDNNDFVVFIEYFFTHNRLADMGITGGLPGTDNAWNNNDFVVFIDFFFAGC